MARKEKRGWGEIPPFPRHATPPRLFSFPLSLSASSLFALLDSPPRVSRESSGTDAQTPIPLPSFVFFRGGGGSCEFGKVEEVEKE